MSHHDGRGAHRPWSEYSLAAKAAIVIAVAVLAPALLALCAAVAMWLWNWLMPEIFKLPRIGFWQSAGLLVLAQLLFKGGHASRAGRSQWRKARLRQRMREDGPEPVPGASAE